MAAQTDSRIAVITPSEVSPGIWRPFLLNPVFYFSIFLMKGFSEYPTPCPARAERGRRREAADNFGRNSCYLSHGNQRDFIKGKGLLAGNDNTLSAIA